LNIDAIAVMIPATTSTITTRLAAVRAPRASSSRLQQRAFAAHHAVEGASASACATQAAVALSAGTPAIARAGDQGDQSQQVAASSGLARTPAAKASPA
jgi:hypothetical protein